jgi:hypothetical protein
MLSIILKNGYSKVFFNGLSHFCNIFILKFKYVLDYTNFLFVEAQFNYTYFVIRVLLWRQCGMKSVYTPVL